MTTFVGTKMKPFTLITLFFWGIFGCSENKIDSDICDDNESPTDSASDTRCDVDSSSMANIETDSDILIGHDTDTGSPPTGADTGPGAEMDTDTDTNADTGNDGCTGSSDYLSSDTDTVTGSPDTNTGGPDAGNADMDTDTDGDTDMDTVANDTGVDTDTDTVANDTGTYGSDAGNANTDTDTDFPEELPPNCYRKPTGVLACECYPPMPCICGSNESACMFYLMQDDADVQCDAPCLLMCGFPGHVCKIDSCAGEIIVCSEALRVCNGPCPNTK